MTRSTSLERGKQRWWLALPLIVVATGAGPANLASPTPPAASAPADASVKTTQAFDLPPLPDEPNQLLRPPVEPTYPSPMPDLPSALFRTPRDLPNGYTGKSGVEPSEIQTTPDFIPIEDRWRIGFPIWDRYDKGHKIGDDYPYEPGSKLNPFRQNVLKGDYPILGQHVFQEITATQFSFMDGRNVPTQTGAFESTARPGSFAFFGHPNQFFFTQYNSISYELFHGDAGFKPKDWMIKFTPVFNVNNASLSELANTNPNVLQGTTRSRTFFAVQELFGEVKLADLSPNYDFASLRVGNQFFTSDFRGFIFSDVNREVRLFGTRNGNRDQFNLVYNRQWEKDTNSGLNSFHDRNQNIVIANYYRQDFLIPGYTVEASIHYNHDNPTFKINKNRQLVRPDPVGIFQRHTIDAVYFGLAGDGHIGRINVNNAFYWVVGHDSLNPLANRPEQISAQMAALELSYDRDWMRFRTSVLWLSGDHNINGGHATGFDSILNNQNFAGGIFAYVQRQSLPLFGVNLINNQSFIPNLRSSTIQGQSNFVNPGLLLYNVGQDMDITPKLKMVNNVNFEWFDATNVLEQYLFAAHIHRGIGADLSSGFVYRPLVSDNVIIVAGTTLLLPGLGFRDVYSNFGSRVDTPFAGFLAMTLSF
jgi:hypothetical protein